MSQRSSSGTKTERSENTHVESSSKRLSDVPDDVLMQIILLMDYDSIKSLGRTSELYKVFKGNKEYLFRELLKRDFGVSSNEDTYKMLDFLQKLDKTSTIKVFKTRKECPSTFEEIYLSYKPLLNISQSMRSKDLEALLVMMKIRQMLQCFNSISQKATLREALLKKPKTTDKSTKGKRIKRTVNSKFRGSFCVIV